MIAHKKDYWVSQLDIRLQTVSAWIARAEGTNEEAVKGLRAAADLEDQTEKHIMMPGPIVPVREMLAEVLVDLGQAPAALEGLKQSGFLMVGAVRFELTTTGTPCRYATRLRYAPRERILPLQLVQHGA